MQFYDKVQSAILLDRGGLSLDDIHKSFVMNDLVFNDVHNKPVEVRPGFVALLGADDLMVTVEFLDRPADFVFSGNRSAPTSIARCSAQTPKT